MTTQPKTTTSNGLTCSPEEHPARDSALPDCEEERTTRDQTSVSASAKSPTNSTQMSLFGSKSPEFSACPIIPLVASSPHLLDLIPPSYTLTPNSLNDGGGSGKRTEPSTDGQSGLARVWLLDPSEPLAGALSTVNISEWPNDASVCLLSQILINEHDPWVRSEFKSTADFTEWLRKYFLSPRCCAGILLRAERRKKTLPPLLARALREVAQELTPTA